MHAVPDEASILSGAEASPPPPPPPPQPERNDRIALRLLQLGAAAVVLMATTYKSFELDRFFIPKELVLHATALSAGFFALRGVKRVQFSRVDMLLLGYLALCLLSVVTATNVWLGIRAFTISASAIAIFWTARSLRTVGLERQLLAALAVAVVLAALTSALQTYGVRTDLFSINRAPGGTLGNRNFIAHVAAFGLPVVLLTTLRARAAGFVVGSIGAALVTASLIITRSRAGWLAALAAMAVLLFAMFYSPALRAFRRGWLRLAAVAVVATAAVVAALTMPNQLRWRSDNPYLESVRGVANFQEGSGRGRLVQYRRSMRMVTQQPILGVGPGNWAVEYPKHAAPRDPSLNNSEPGTTANPWPSSDWVASLSERGLPATLLLLAFFIGISFTSIRQLMRAQSVDEAMAAATLVATLAATLVAGLFDAVLLLALPVLLVWATLGALWVPLPHHFKLPEKSANRIMFALLVVCAIGVVRSTSQLTAMGLYSAAPNRRALSIASLIDPGSYRVHVRLARSGSGLKRTSRCEHALAARALYPSASEARGLSRGCRE